MVISSEIKEFYHSHKLDINRLIDNCVAYGANILEAEAAIIKCYDEIIGGKKIMSSDIGRHVIRLAKQNKKTYYEVENPFDIIKKLRLSIIKYKKELDDIALECNELEDRLLVYKTKKHELLSDKLLIKNELGE